MEDQKWNFPTEDEACGNPFRDAYLEGVRELIEEARKKADEKRRKRAKKILEDPEKHRRELIEMLGWPLTERTDGKNLPEVIKTPITEYDGVTVERLQFRVFPNLLFYGILFRYGEEKRPLVISQHGGGGTPELCSGLLERGTVNYNDMTKRVLQYGVHVFAPQMLVWDPAQFQTELVQLEDYAIIRRELDQSLKQLGGSIVSVDLTSLMSALDYLEAQDYVCADKIGMVGLSYGGFYTLYAAAVDKRIKAALCSCFFRKPYQMLLTDLIWQNNANLFTDSEAAMLVYPRKLHIQSADHDDLYPEKEMLEAFDQIREYAKETKVSQSPEKQQLN